MSDKKKAKYIESAREHLNGEQVLAAVFGAYETESMGADTVRNGVLIATETRVVFFAKRMFGFDLEETDYRRVSSIQQAKKMLGHTVTLTVTGNTLTMKWIKDEDLPTFMSTVRERIAA
jgi:intracellular sulfur oxidation DsrE/DsrF family protein